jgi:hypothetical protein
MSIAHRARPAAASSPRVPSITRPDRIAALEAELAQLRQQQRDADDAQLLRAVFRSTRGCVFDVRDLVELAAIDGDLREALGDRRPKQLGKLLARVANRDLEGLCVRRVKPTETGWVWELHFHERAGDRA